MPISPPANVITSPKATKTLLSIIPKGGTINPEVSRSIPKMQRTKPAINYSVNFSSCVIYFIIN